MNKRIWCLGLLLLFVCTLFSSAQANVRASKMRQGVDRKVTELMILAQQARTAGDLANAELFWMHARELRPSLRRPTWLDRAIESAVEPAPLDEDQFLARVASLTYEQAKMILEDKLEKDPNNSKVRQLFLELAQKNSDHTEITRHNSLLASDASDSWAAYLWDAVALLILILLIWQVIGLYLDVSR